MTTGYVWLDGLLVGFGLVAIVRLLWQARPRA